MEKTRGSLLHKVCPLPGKHSKQLNYRASKQRKSGSNRHPQSCPDKVPLTDSRENREAEGQEVERYLPSSITGVLFTSFNLVHLLFLSVKNT